MLLLLLWNSFVWCQPKDVDALAANVIVSLVDSNGSLLLALWLEMSVGQPGWMEPVVNFTLITKLRCYCVAFIRFRVCQLSTAIRRFGSRWNAICRWLEWWARTNCRKSVENPMLILFACSLSELCIVITELCILLTVVVLIGLSPILRGSSFSGRAYVFALMQYLVQWGRERLTRTGGCMLATFHQFCSLL